MPSISTSPYQDQEETAPIIIKTPPATKENILTAFRFGRASARDTFDALVKVGAFDKDLLKSTMLAVAYGALMQDIREAIHETPDDVRDQFCAVAENAVNDEKITCEMGRLFLDLFDGEPVE
jgi:chorismate synthase